MADTTKPPLKPTVPASFYLSLTEFLITSKHQIVAISDEFGLTSMQAMTLLMTNENTPRPMSSFCKFFGCDASNVTGIIDGLEQKKLVSRREHPTDRRIKVVQLESKGTTLRHEFLEKLARDSDFLFRGLSASEMAQFIHLIDKLAANQLTTFPTK